MSRTLPARAPEELALQVEAVVYARLRGLTGELNRPYSYRAPAGGWAVTWAAGPAGWAVACLEGGQVAWGGVSHPVEPLAFPPAAGVRIHDGYKPGLWVCPPEPRPDREPLLDELVAAGLLEHTRVGRCHYCGADPVKLTVDHVVPRSRGGGNSAANRVRACGPCNVLKGDFLLSELPEGWASFSRMPPAARRRVRRAAKIARMVAEAAQEEET